VWGKKRESRDGCTRAQEILWACFDRSLDMKCHVDGDGMTVK
jgi:hypothetical protein